MMPAPRHCPGIRVTTRDEFRFDHEDRWPKPPLPTREDTMPRVLTQCPACLDGSHVWSEPGPEVLPGTPEFGEHTVLHYRCVCDICFGYCDGRRISVRIEPVPAGHRAGQRRHVASHRPPPPQLTLQQISPWPLPEPGRPELEQSQIEHPDHRILAYPTRITEGPDVLPEPRHPIATYPDLARTPA